MWIITKGDADVDHSQTIGGDTAKFLGDISPPCFGTTAHSTRSIFTYLNITLLDLDYKGCIRYQGMKI